MKLSLYNIQKEFLELADILLEKGGELTEELSEKLALNQHNLETKGINYGMVVKQMEAENEIIDSEIKRLQAHKQSRTKSIERLKDSLKKAMELYSIEKIESPIMKINFRNSESVELDQDVLFEERFMRIKADPDKAKIKEALQNGEKIIGAVLKQNRNLQLK